MGSIIAVAAVAVVVVGGVIAFIKSRK